MVHGVSLTTNLQVHFDFLNLARTAFEGFLFALLVQRTKSIVPAIIFHNILNLVGNH
jgi:CAAX prenyl protease-like protein